jgi:DNA-binding IclR family transcriptional regulator
MTKGKKSLKCKSARRTIEILEYMSLNRNGITVMDVARTLGIPQSTTSELLAALVDIGIAAKDATSRYYYATPRLAAIGITSQPSQINNNKFLERMEGIAVRTGHLIGLFGINEANIQPYWVSGLRAGANKEIESVRTEVDPAALFENSTKHLASGAVGQTLLSSLECDRSTRILWRIRSEVGDHEKFSHNDLCDLVQSIREQGYASGASGFGMELGATAVALPSAYGPYPLAVAAFYPSTSLIDPDALAQDILREIEGSVSPPSDLAELAAPEHKFQTINHLTPVHSD